MNNDQFEIDDLALSIVAQIGEHMPGGFFIYNNDEAKELIYANEAVFRIFGCRDFEDFKDYCGFNFHGMVHPDDYEMVAVKIREQKRDRLAKPDQLEYRIIRKDGETRWIDDHGHYVESQTYDDLRYVFISDVTEKHMETESNLTIRSAVIEALTRVYDSVWLIKDMEAQEFELYRIDDETIHVLPAQEALNITKFSDALQFYSNLVLEEDRQRFLDAVAPEKIIENTEDKLIYSVPFRRVFEDFIRYYRLEFAKIDLGNGATSIVGGFKDVDDEVRRDKQAEQDMNIRSAVIEALTRVYDSVWLISDVESEKFELYRIDEETSHLLPAQEALNITKVSEALQFYSNLVLEDDRQRFLESVDLQRIIKSTESNLVYSIPFRRMFENGVRHYRLEFARVDLGNGAISLVGGYKDVDEEVRKDLQVQQALNLRSAVIEGLTRVYDSVWLINDIEKEQFELYRIDEETSHLLPAREAINIMKFSEALQFYSNLVLEEDRQRFLDAVATEKIIRNTEDKLIYSVPFRRVFEKNVRYYRLEFAKIDLLDGTKGIVGGFKDVDEEVRKEQHIQEALREAIDTANASNQAKSDFLASMSHDMRTPMNGIIGMTAIAMKNLDDRDRVSDCLGKISDSSNHLLSLINEVLDMNKIESGNIELHENEFFLADLIDDMLTLTRPQIQERNHTFRVNIAGVEHEHVVGDSSRIKQVFLNILSNAIKYTPEGGEISLSVNELSTGIKGFSHYQFEFEDNGYGMSEEFQKRIFDPFTRAEDKQIADIQGTGLGMAITRNIARLMGGDVSVESELGKGSKFTVNLYLKYLNTKTADYGVFSTLRVLVADDDLACCETTSEILSGMGMRCEWALDGTAAVDCVASAEAQDRQFSVIIVDWRMPGCDGADTVRRIRQAAGEDVFIIVSSSGDVAEIEQVAKEAGATTLIGKPLFRTKLTALFNSLFDVDTAADSQEKPAVTLDELDLTGHRVLLAEDNDLNAEIATNFLELTGLEVDWAKDGKQAVEMLDASADGYYALIIMDVRMPVMTGIEATKAIRSLDRSYAKEIPIVAMTANAFAEDVLNCKNAGMNEHMKKPIDVDELARVLATYVK